jgi:hypothetical protein
MGFSREIDDRSCVDHARARVRRHVNERRGSISSAIAGGVAPTSG